MGADDLSARPARLIVDFLRIEDVPLSLMFIVAVRSSSGIVRYCGAVS